LEKIDDYFGFLYNIGSISKMAKDNLMKHCMNIQFLLEVGGAKSINV